MKLHLTSLIIALAVAQAGSHRTLGADQPTTLAATTQPADKRVNQLCMAIVTDDPATALKLIADGVDVTQKAGKSNALYYAAGSPHSDMLDVTKALLAHGADVHARNKGGFTALHSACFSGRMEAVELLIAKGADVNARDDGQDTPLHVAAAAFCHDSEKVINTLLAHGAKIDAIGRDNDTPLDLARIDDLENFDRPALLRSKGAKTGAQLRAAAATQPAAK